MKSVEGVKEFLLRTCLTNQVLDIIDQKNIHCSVFVSEFFSFILGDCFYDLIREFVRWHIENLHITIVLEYIVGYGLHKMSLAQS